MRRIVFATLLVAVCYVCTTKGVKLKDCTNKKLEINANSPGPIICKSITNNGSVTWRHGDKAILGECKSDGNCLFFFPNEYNLTREANSTDSHLHFLANIVADDRVEISCEDRQSGTNDSCTLNVKGVEITNCRSKKLVIFENSSQAITCRNIPDNGIVIWRSGADKNYIGECSALGKCLNNRSALYNISREKDSADSHLVILQNPRGLVNARITCEDELGNTTDTCQLVIRRHPVLRNCTITTNNTNRIVSGHCIVDEFFSSDNNTQCQWTMRNTWNKGTVQTQDHLMSNVSFNYTCQSIWSCRGTCSFTSPLPHNKGVYIYTIMVLDSPSATLSLNITINEDDQTRSTNSIPSATSPHTGVKLQNCTNKKLEINANSPGPIICKNITKNGSVVWRLGQEAGALGECKPDGNCSSFFPNKDNKYNLTREANSTDSHFEFLVNVTADDGVEISCEDQQDGTSDTCTLNITGVEITNCRSKKLVIFENSSQEITCRNIPVNGTVIWRSGADKNYIGECSALGKCLNSRNDSYHISREKDSSDSHLVILENLRGLTNARITCEDESGNTTDTCQLIIRRHPVLQNCTITTDNTNRTVSGHCIVDEFFSSDNNTQCHWTRRDTGNKSAVQTQDHLMSNVSFNYTCQSLWSCRGTCSFTSQLPHNKGKYIYTIIVLDFPNATLSFNITINGSDYFQTTPVSPESTSPSDDENQTKSHQDDNNQTMSTDAPFCTPSHSGEDFPTTAIDHSSSSPSEPFHTVISTPAQESPSEGNSSQLGLIFGILLAFAILTTASTVFFIFRRRKLQRQSRRHLETASTQREQEFEEFINDVYQSADPSLIQPLQNT
ncbi:uncharacterized protein LOC112568168 isoform X2 [Pomacea canaliculata]|uniref:uncharacterized protein LOC112568168 isoform X2 n=1 Tax=Pomacea canaliculata TaxID=400727 RepID=UPI000D7353FA|nr:uncharacterized protein LOC112568168 isoform X2 [Pomacea canaliculata]